MNFAMAKYYQHLLSPLKVRNTVLKSRFMYPCAQPHFLQGPEAYPADPVVTFYSNLAKNGVALLTFHDLANNFQRTMGGNDTPHFCMYDINDPGCQNYFSHFAHMVHYYGGKLSTSLAVDMELPFFITDHQPMPDVHNPIDDGAPYRVLFGSIVGPEDDKDDANPEMAGIGMDPNMRPQVFDDEKVDFYINKMIEKAKLYKSLGFDSAQLDLNRAAGQFFNPRINDRTDKWGQDRGLFAKTLFSRLRKALGEDFILVVNAPSFFAGLTLDETVELIKIIEPYADILHLRDGTEDGGDGEYAPSIEKSKYLKEHGVKMPIAINTPYMDLDRLDAVIASGAADMISSARMMICQEHLGEILKNGQGDELQPCIECNNCRGTSWSGDWISQCTINPQFAVAYRENKMIEPVKQKKRVALIGGGPGAMKCALYLQERGHEAVIFEKSGELGGQIKTSRAPEFKWRLARYLDYLIHMVEKRGIEVRLNTEATPELIEAEGFDVVVAATGAEPKLPNIPGAEQAAKYDIINVYAKEKEIGKKVVVVGGSSTACEAAIFLAEKGHEVTELSRKNIIGYDYSPVRGRIYINRKARTDGVEVIPHANTTEIGKGYVKYTLRDGSEHTIECDDVIAAGGMKANADSAISFCNCTAEFYMLGDCKGDPGSNLLTANRDAFAIAMQI
jgi:2,4-dienoyl-CoA reductase-like NADH-dependent reductase (Old Yellow Enzyme family)/thioredoxin reductase